VGASLHFLFLCAGPYVADFSAEAGNSVRFASVAVNLFRFELDFALVRPMLGDLLFPFKVFCLSCFERFTLVAVKSAVGGHF
jgi:hypothetical protein